MCIDSNVVEETRFHEKKCIASVWRHLHTWKLIGLNSNQEGGHIIRRLFPERCSEVSFAKHFSRSGNQAQLFRQGPIIQSPVSRRANQFKMVLCQKPDEKQNASKETLSVTKGCNLR